MKTFKELLWSFTGIPVVPPSGFSSQRVHIKIEEQWMTADEIRHLVSQLRAEIRRLYKEKLSPKAYLKYLEQEREKR